jgi:hypothetical protein
MDQRRREDLHLLWLMSWLGEYDPVWRIVNKTSLIRLIRIGPWLIGLGGPRSASFVGV